VDQAVAVDQGLQPFMALEVLGQAVKGTQEDLAFLMIQFIEMVAAAEAPALLAQMQQVLVLAVLVAQVQLIQLVVLQ
jgi:hypothetical protein